MANDTKLGIFLDRDGTIIADKHYIKLPEEVELLDGSKQAITRLKANGHLLFLFTNQSGVGRGLITVDDVSACNERMLALLGGGVFEDICVAPEGPDDTPIYRKPSPRFILEMIKKHGLVHKNCFMVGDKESDILAGVNASVRPVLISQDSLFSSQMANKFRQLKSFPSLEAFSYWAAPDVKQFPGSCVK